MFLHKRQEFIARSRNGKHSKRMFKRSFLSGNASGRTAILERVDLVSKFIGRPHGGLDAAICKESRQDHILDIVLAQQKVKVCGMESTQPTLTFNDDISLFRSHDFTNLGSPLSGSKGLTILDALQNAVRVIRDLLVPLL